MPYIYNRDLAALFKTMNGVATDVKTLLANQATIMANQAKEEKTMTALTDAVTKVSGDLDTLATNLDNDSKAIQAAIAALKNAPPSPDVQAAITALQALDTRVQGYSTTLGANTDAINAALPPGP